MFRTAFTRTLLLRGVMAAAAFSVVVPAAMYADSADAKRSRGKKSKAKAKAKAAKAKKAKARAAAMKAKKTMHSKHMGAIERLDQIATTTKNKELADIVARLKTKEAERFAK